MVTGSMLPGVSRLRRWTLVSLVTGCLFLTSLREETHSLPDSSLHTTWQPGKFEGVLQDTSGKPLSINGIWSISFANSATPNSYDPDEAPASELYFTAGPNQGTDGLFGYLIPVATDQVQGNQQ